MTNERASYVDSCADVSSVCEWPFYGVYASFRLACKEIMMGG